jgi:hypothetical protein
MARFAFQESLSHKDTLTFLASSELKASKETKEIWDGTGSKNEGVHTPDFMCIFPREPAQRVK